jgi:hypothetical protein
MADPIKIEADLGQASDRLGALKLTFSLNSQGEAEIWVHATEAGGKRMVLIPFRAAAFARLKALVDKADAYMQKAALNEIKVPMSINLDSK